MAQPLRLIAIIEREDAGFVSLCPELDITSQGSFVEEARTNLVEALSLILVFRRIRRTSPLFFEIAAPSEVAKRFTAKFLLRKLRFRLGRLRVLSGNEVCAYWNRTDSSRSASVAAIE